MQPKQTSPNPKLNPVTRIAHTSHSSKRWRKSQQRKALVLRGELPEYTTLREVPDEASGSLQVTPATLLKVDSSSPGNQAMTSLPQDYSSLVLRCICPRCSKVTELSYSKSCQNKSKKNGRICGYELPKTVSACNSHMKSKIEKRIVPPTGVFSGLISHNPSPEYYLYCRELVMASGNLHFHPDNNSFSIFCTPSGETGIAVVFSGSTGTSYSASGIGMIPNQSPHEMHPYFDNLSPNAKFVCSVKEAILECPLHPNSNLYKWRVSGQVIASWDSQFKSGYYLGV